MRTRLLTTSLVALAGVCALGASSARPDAGASTGTSHRPGVGALAGARSQTIEVWMAGRPRAAQHFVEAVSTRGSASYRRFLSPAAYTERFGPRATQVAAVESYLDGAGLDQVHASADDDFVSATGSTSIIARALSVPRFGDARDGSEGAASSAGSGDRDVTVPASIADDILTVTGIGGGRPAPDGMAAAAAPAGGAGHCSHFWGQHTQAIAPAFHGVSRASTSVCGYSAAKIRAAYGLSSGDTGAGKTIAFIQTGRPVQMRRALSQYARRNGLPTPRTDQYHEITVGDQSPKCLNGAATESALDSESAYAMAPRADQLMVDGSTCGSTGVDESQNLLNAELAPLTGPGTSPAAAIESVSYTLFGKHGHRLVPRSELTASAAIARRAAAEGVSLLVSSGDSPGVEQPTTPDVTVVGGTTLGLGSHGQRLFETGWSTTYGERAGTSRSWSGTDRATAGAGGGVSDSYREPGYQRGVVPAALAGDGEGHAGRAVPDIAADADPASPMLVGEIVKLGNSAHYRPEIGGGTSQATPLIAGIVADSEQGQRPTLGLLNPRLYSLAGSRAFNDVRPLGSSAPQTDRAFYRPGTVKIAKKYSRGFLIGLNDSQGAGVSRQVTAPGYDTMTGLGTPNGSAFIDALR